MASISERSVGRRLSALAQLGRHDRGIDRPVATPSERAARELFVTWARDAGLSVSQDRVGNLFARREAQVSDAKAILVGSHLDTVATGGAYDGAYGVAGAICAIDILNKRGEVTRHPIEAVAWMGEEGSRFPLGCLGSSTFCDLTSEIEALKLVDQQGISLEEALASPLGGLLSDVPRRDGRAVAAYLELHVEQGPVLEAAGVAVGIVTAIAAQRRYSVCVRGESGHAGTVPMQLRADALCAAAELVLAIEAAAESANDCVATVGRFVVEPGGTNVIPSSVTFSLDVRSPDEKKIEYVEDALHKALESARTNRRVQSDMECLELRPAAPMAPHLRDAIARAMRSHGAFIDVASGAGHDAMCLARIAPAAMIFVPSIGGMSHVAQEYSTPSDLQLGVEALADALIEVDRAL